MRKQIVITLLLFRLGIRLFSQVDFSGSADMAINTNIPESGDYESLLNPGNLMGISDLGLNSALIAKIDGGDEKTTFSAWFSLKEFPIGQALLSAAYGDSIQEGGVFELTRTLGDTVFTMDLMRLSANVYLSDNISMEVGRQSMLTGYGYGWNPIDFANPLKNPLDPGAALRGVDGLSFKILPNFMSSLKIYGILPRDLLSSGLDYEEIKFGGELTLYFSGLEMKLAGFYDYDERVGSDAYTPSLGAGFMIDLWGVGLYSEAAVRKGSRNYFTDGGLVAQRKEEWLFSILVGLEYTFTNELYGVVEYFYNGEGFNESERFEYRDSVIAFIGAMGSPTADLFSLYSPGYFARHYIMLNLMQPLYSINTDINLAAIYSPDSGALTLMPSVNYSFSGNFSGKLAYMGMLDLEQDDFNEVTALPVRHVISAVFTYSF